MATLWITRNRKNTYEHSLAKGVVIMSYTSNIMQLTPALQAEQNWLSGIFNATYEKYSFTYGSVEYRQIENANCCIKTTWLCATFSGTYARTPSTWRHRYASESRRPTSRARVIKMPLIIPAPIAVAHLPNHLRLIPGLRAEGFG